MVVRDCLTLSRIAATATRHATNLCNVPNYQPIWDKKKRGLLIRANAVVRPYGCTAEIGGDPRGCCLKLFAEPETPELRGNTWGGNESGYGI